MKNCKAKTNLNGLPQTALADIEHRLRGPLTAFFLRRCIDATEAEDLTQEVFLRLAMLDANLKQQADNYIFTIAANLLRDRARRTKIRTEYREAKRLEDYLELDTLDPFRFASARQDLTRLALGIAALPKKTRRIFTLYRIESVDKQRIAESFGLSVRMVEIHIQRALIALRDGLDD